MPSSSGLSASQQPPPSPSLFDSGRVQPLVQSPPAAAPPRPDPTITVVPRQNLPTIGHQTPPNTSREDNRRSPRPSIPTFVFGRRWSEWRLDELRRVLDHHSIDYPAQAPQTQLLVILYNSSLGNEWSPTSPPQTYYQLMTAVKNYFCVRPMIYRQTLSDGRPRPLHQATALLDSGAKDNIIAIDLVRRFDLEHVGPSRLTVGIAGQHVTTYGVYSVDIEVTDSRQQTRRKTHCFVATNRTDMFGVDMVLGFPWHSRENVRVEHPCPGIYGWSFPD
jgi:hypothetical protein